MSELVNIQMTKEELDTLYTIVFEFCDSLDKRKDKHGNYKNQTWADCLIFERKWKPKFCKLLHGVEDER